MSLNRDAGPHTSAGEYGRLVRVHAALSRVNQAIVRRLPRADLLQAVCLALVDAGGFRLARVGWHDAATHELVPVAHAGDDLGLVGRVHLYTDERPEGRGLSGTAFRTAAPMVSNDLLSETSTTPWRDEMVRAGIRSAGAFPIRTEHGVQGVLTVYAEEVGFFQEQEIALLTEAAADVAFALDTLDQDERRQRAEAEAARERQFSEAIIESTPGVLYVYDEHGRFLRWNRNFEIVTGYSGAEIARMHPLDFFEGDDRERVQARIADVMTHGESSVEAGFRTRSGVTIPYLFTGRRIELDGVPCLVGMGIDIADRTAVARRLAESEQKYRDLVERANSIILRWTPEGRVTFLNEFGQRFFGFSEAEIIGRDVIGTIVPPTESGGRDLAKLMAAVRSDPAAFEQNVNENIRRDGQRVSIAWTNRVERDERGEVTTILSVGTDVTARVRVEAALRASEERYRSTLDGMMEGCQIIGHDWRYLYLNEAAAVQNRRPNAEMLGRTMQECWPGIEQSRVFAVLAQSMTERVPKHEELEFTFGDGASRWFDIRCQPVPEGIFVLSIDRTEGRLAEAALRELNETLEHRVAERTAELAEARDRAEAADRLKSAFLATMSHELRTPLNSIIGFTGIVLQGLAGPLNEEQTRQLGMVRASSRHLLDLINDVLDISKIEAGQLEVQPKRFALGAALTKVTATVTPLADRKGLAVRVDVPDDLPEVTSDQRRVEQIVLNLLSNAVKFTDRGEVSVTARVVGGSPAAIAIAVADTGIGIAPEGLRQLFQPFRQLDAGLTRQHEGTGLGLAICRRLADLLGGSIAVTSAQGRGSVFTFTVPVDHPRVTP